MATVIDLLRQIAQDVAPDADVLRGPLTIPPRQMSPFMLDVEGAAGWSAAFGRPTTGQHALALAALRASEAVAFMGGGTLPSEDLLLMVYAQLRARRSTALWLVPDAAAVRRSTALLHRFQRRANVGWLALADAPARPPFVPLVVATYDELHARLLPFADRAWRWFWRDVRTIALPDLHRASGIDGAHLPWLLRRALRVCGQPPVLVGGSAPLAEAATAFQTLLGRAWRVIDATAGPKEATLLMLWRCDDRHATLDQLARLLRGRGLSIAVVGSNERDDQVLRARWGAANVAAVEDGAEAAIALVSGIPREASVRDSLLRSGYRMVVMLAGDDPHEAVFANDVERLAVHAPTLLVAHDNPHVANFHLQAAAVEQPLMPSEIERWHAAERAEFLVEKQRLQVLNDGALQPGLMAVEPATTLRAATSSEPWVDVRDPLGAVIATIRPAVADWRGLPGTTWAGDLVVANYDDEASVVDLAVDERRRLARPAVSYRISPRTQIDAREWSFDETSLVATHWSAEVRQRVEGLEEYLVDRAPARPRVAAPLDARWIAHACAVEMPVVPRAPASAGWSLKEALLLLTTCAAEDVVISYDASSRALWLIETAPGGNGVAAWAMEHLLDVLQMARTIVAACVSNRLYRRLAADEQQWLDPHAVLSALPETVPVRAEPSEQRRVEAVAQVPPRSMAGRSRVYALQPAEATARGIRRGGNAPPDAAPVSAPLEPDVRGNTPTVEEEPFESGEVSAVVALTASDRERSPTAADADERSPREHAARSRVYDRVEPNTPDVAPEATTAEAGDVAWDVNAAAAVSSPSTPFEVEDITWEVETSHPTAAAEAEAMSRNAEAPPIEDIRWEPNRAEQVSLGEEPPAVPPLGRETPALNAPKPSRRDAPASRGSDQRRQNERAAPWQTRLRSGWERGDRRDSPSPPEHGRTTPAPQPQAPRHGDQERPSSRRDEQPQPTQPSSSPSGRRQASPDPPARQPEERPTSPPPPERARPAPDPPAEQLPNVGSMIARMRRLREERERQQGAKSVPAPPPPSADAEDVPLRFKAGQQVRCVPYGQGVVLSSKAVDGREQLQVIFPDVGKITVDPDVNAVRLVSSPPEQAAEE